MPQLAQNLRIPMPLAQETHTDMKAGTEAETGKKEPAIGEVPNATLLLWNSALVFAVIVGFAALAKKNLDPRKAPTGIQRYVEYVVEQLNGLTTGIIGHGGEKYTPLVGTIFLYILGMNLIGNIPGFHSPSANVSITLALGLVVFVFVQFEGLRQNGFGHITHFMGPKLGKYPLMAPLMFPIEIISECVRPFTLAIRLFGNIFGEDLLIVIFAGLLGTLVGSWAGWFPLQLPLMILGLLTAFVQALVFSMLTCIYLSLVQRHGDHEAEFDEDAYHGDAPAGGAHTH